MKIEYTLDKEDFLKHTLFTISQNKKSNSIIKFSRFMVPFLFFTFVVNKINTEDYTSAVIFGILMVVSILFYKKLSTRTFSKAIKKTYASRFNQKEAIEFTSEYLFFENAESQSKTKLSALEKVSEIDTLFFIHLPGNTSYIVPKKDITAIDELKKFFETNKLEVIDKLDWKF